MAEAHPSRVGRRLAAIVAADVAGYSRLMGLDEEATHARFTALLKDAIVPAIAEHGGRVVKSTGDGFLAEFPSAVEAVRAAMQFQTRIKELTTAEAEDRRIVFRVGINIGDVIVEPHDIFGDGVNIAARLESISDPGGICVSSSAYEQVRGKVGVEFADLGEQNLKNIACPVRVYVAVQDGLGPVTKGGSTTSAALSAPRLSMVVLPFVNIGGDPEQEYFVDGMTESLTTDLSRIRGAFVIARNTAFTFKNKAVDVNKLRHELSVRYVLEGSVQRAASRLRVNVQLIDAETGNHLWAERFDKPVTDIFDMQDEIVSRLANQLQAELTEEEARRSERSANPSSMEFYFRGMALLNKSWTHDCLTEARCNFERALALDSTNLDAMIGTAIVDLINGSAFLSDDVTLCPRAEATLKKVLSFAPNHAFAHLILGATLVSTNRPAQAVAECERALALDRNLAEAHAQIGLAKHYMGLSAETDAHLVEAFRLSPRDRLAYRWLMWRGCAKMAVGDDAEALGWLRESVEANRNYAIGHFLLAASLALLGYQNEADEAVKAGLPAFLCVGFASGSRAITEPTSSHATA